jgi:tetratricopeptide (TPR) repeat protein
MWYLVFALALLFFAILSIPIITLLHELGHAIPALLFTQDTVTMYVGSYGNPENNREIKLGRLIMLFNRNTVIWRQGICKHSSTGIIRQIIIIAGGPVCTVLIALAFTFIIFSYDLHEYFKLFILVFTAASFLSFLHNIIPDSKHFLSHDGNNAYNDGSLLKSLLKYKGISPTFREGVELFNAKKYKEAVKVFAKITANDRETADAYRFTILSFIYLNKLNKALHYHELLRSIGGLNAEDYSNGGLIKSRLFLPQEAIDEYSQCLSINPAHIHCLNNRGYTYNTIGEYVKALTDLDAAIAIQPHSAFSYNNRGLSKIKLGQLEEGFEDIQQSIRLESTNAYAYLYLGIYYLEKNDFENALSSFEMSKALDATIQEVGQYIQLIKASLTQA